MSISRQPLQHRSGEQQRVFVDFHNADAQGRLRLNCIGTIEDLSAQKIELQSGQQLTLYSEDLEVEGIVEYSDLEHLWVVIINWDEIRQVEEVDAIEKRLFDFVEKLESMLKLIKADTQASSDGIQDFTSRKLEKLINEAKRDLRNTRAALSREQDTSEAVFYQQFARIFGEEEAKEIWSARSWNTNIVLRDLALVLKDEPKLRQQIEQKGFNLEEIINTISQEIESKEFSTELSQIERKTLTRLREVICC